MHTLEEVQDYLSNLSISNARIKECYDLISNPASRVNTEDEKWVACEQEHEKATVVEAIDEILDEKYSTSNILEAVTSTCSQFAKVSHKHRIPFYVLVIDKLIP